MQEFDIPIFQKTYALYKTLYGFRLHVPKQDRYTLWQRCEGLTLDVLEHVLLASQRPKATKEPALEAASVKLNALRMLVRLAKDVRAIDGKKYVALEALIDEIGRMLGGWIRSCKSPPPQLIACLSTTWVLHRWNTQVFCEECAVPGSGQTEVVVAVVIPVVVDVQAVRIEVADVHPVAVRIDERLPASVRDHWELRFSASSPCMGFGSSAALGAAHLRWTRARIAHSDSCAHTLPGSVKHKHSGE